MGALDGSEAFKHTPKLDADGNLAKSPDPVLNDETFYRVDQKIIAARLNLLLLPKSPESDIQARAGLITRLSQRPVITMGPLKGLGTGIQKLATRIYEHGVEQGIGTEAQTRTEANKRDYLLGRDDATPIEFGREGDNIVSGIIFGFEEPSWDGQKTILLCTGSGKSSTSYSKEMVDAFRNMGHRVMTFDYEGFGDSPGVRSEENVYKSTETAYDCLKQLNNQKALADSQAPQQIVAWGFSMGGGAVVELATKHKIDIVLDRAQPSMAKAAYEVSPRGLKTIAKTVMKSVAHFDNVKKLPSVQGRVLIAQEEQNLEYASLLAEAARNSGNDVHIMLAGERHIEKDSTWLSQKVKHQQVQRFLNGQSNTS